MSPDDLARILDELGQRLGPTGQHVFELAVRQIYIDGVSSLVALAVWVLVAWRAWPRVYRWQQADTSSLGDRGLVLLVGGLVYASLGIGVVVWAAAAIPSMFNPEYAALRDILSAVAR